MHDREIFYDIITVLLEFDMKYNFLEKNSKNIEKIKNSKLGVDL